MSAARITIGGVDVCQRPSGVSGGTQRAVEGQTASSIDRVFSRPNGGEASVSLALERTPWSTCPLPPGPWRVAGAAALGGLMLALIVCLMRHRTRSSQELPETA